jgi:hypothetical protein
MTEHQEQSHWSGERAAGVETPLPDDAGVWPDGTVPRVPARVEAEDDPTILGFPAVVGVDDGDDLTATRDAWADRPTPAVEDGFDPPVQLVTVPRADPIAGIALVLAGVAAVGSLWLPWRQDEADTGAALVRRGLAVAGSGVDDLSRSGGLWAPVTIVLGGVLLLLLGVLLFLPSRTHRVVGVLSLLVATAVTAGVLFLAAQAGWNSAVFDRGMWCAVAVAGLGILGALKAMLTVPRVAMRARRTARH